MQNVTRTLTGQPIIVGGTRSAVTAHMLSHNYPPGQPHRGETCIFCPPDVAGGKLDVLERKREVIEWHPHKDAYEFVSLTNVQTAQIVQEQLVPRAVDRLVASIAELAAILRIIFRIQDKRIYPTPKVTNAQLGFNYGGFAGQRFSHPMWHIIGNDWPKPRYCCWCALPNHPWVITQTNNLVAVLDGVRAGETIIAAKFHDWDWRNGAEEISSLLHRVVILFKERFKRPLPFECLKRRFFVMLMRLNH